MNEGNVFRAHLVGGSVGEGSSEDVVPLDSRLPFVGKVLFESIVPVGRSAVLVSVLVAFPSKVLLPRSVVFPARVPFVHVVELSGTVEFGSSVEVEFSIKVELARVEFESKRVELVSM